MRRKRNRDTDISFLFKPSNLRRTKAIASALLYLILYPFIIAFKVVIPFVMISFEFIIVICEYIYHINITELKNQILRLYQMLKRMADAVASKSS